MDENSMNSVKTFFAFLMSEEAVFFAMDLSIHLLYSLVRMYCAKLSFSCSLPLKRMAIVPSHSLQVRVLLTELYPNQYSILGGAPYRSNEHFSVDDYLICLQKIDFDSELGHMDDLNFLFQANHLPISVFLSNSQNCIRESGACQAFITPTTSTGDAESKPVSLDVGLSSYRIVSVEPEENDLLLTPQQISSSKEFTFDADPPENLTHCIPEQLLGSEMSSESMESTYSSDNNADGVTPDFIDFSPPSPYSSVVSPLQHDAESENPPPPPLIGHVTPSSYRGAVCAGPLTNADTPKKIDFPSFSLQPHNGVLKSLSNIRQTPQPRHHPHVGHDHFQRQSITESETFVWPRYDKPRHICVIDSRDSDSSEGIVALSDSKSYSSVSRKSCWQEKEELEKEWGEVADESEGDEEGFESWGEEDGETKLSSLSTSTSGSALQSSFYDRNIRDINILNRLAVPFSYEEVAYSSNECFREIKSKPGLTFDQVSAMLNARRRATNRQAAERCRRVKSAVRDGLASQLDSLRLEHSDLARRITRTRKQRQQKWDELTSAQKYLLHNLVDSSGTPLDPSQWRIQTTSDGELILMSINVSENINNRNYYGYGRISMRDTRGDSTKSH